MRYIGIPNEIDVQQIRQKGFSLSCSQYKTLLMKNDNSIFVRDFLSRQLTRRDLGTEVGSISYIGQSNKYFIRTKALQSHTFLPEVTQESTLPILPNSFIQMNLKEGDFLISKDSNIGESVILDQDYENYMISGAIYRLPIKKWKYYLFAMVKHDIFREQLDFMVPKSATIRHAKTMFLDVKIPLPKNNTENVIKYIEILTQSVINKEKEIRYKHNLIHQLIEKELKENQKSIKFEFDYPNFKEVKTVGRLDTARYSKEYKEFNHLITNYKNGFFDLLTKGYKISRGQNLQVTNIGKSYYSDDFKNGFYQLASSSNFSEYSTLEKYTFIGNRKKLKGIKSGDIIFSSRGAQFGRVIFFPNEPNAITNIDNIHIQSSNSSIDEKIFITMFFNLLRFNKHIYKIAFTGSGANSLTQYLFGEIQFPNFPANKQKEISVLYYDPEIKLNANDLTLENYLAKDKELNKTAGILVLDKTVKQIKKQLDKVINQIVNDEDVAIDFSFLL